MKTFLIIFNMIMANSKGRVFSSQKQQQESRILPSYTEITVTVNMIVTISIFKCEGLFFSIFSRNKKGQNKTESEHSDCKRLTEFPMSLHTLIFQDINRSSSKM